MDSLLKKRVRVIVIVEFLGLGLCLYMRPTIIPLIFLVATLYSTAKCLQ